MKWIKRVGAALVLLVVFVWVIVFTAENTSRAPLSLVFFTLPEASISVWVVGGFTLGGLLGLLLSLLLITRLKATHLSTKRQLQQCRQQLMTQQTAAQSNKD